MPFSPISVASPAGSCAQVGAQRARVERRGVRAARRAAPEQDVVAHRRVLIHGFCAQYATAPAPSGARETAPSPRHLLDLAEQRGEQRALAAADAADDAQQLAAPQREVDAGQRPRRGVLAVGVRRAAVRDRGRRRRRLARAGVGARARTSARTRPRTRPRRRRRPRPADASSVASMSCSRPHAPHAAYASADASAGAGGSASSPPPAPPAGASGAAIATCSGSTPLHVDRGGAVVERRGGARAALVVDDDGAGRDGRAGAVGVALELLLLLAACDDGGPNNDFGSVPGRRLLGRLRLLALGRRGRLVALGARQLPRKVPPATRSTTSGSRPRAVAASASSAT